MPQELDRLSCVEVFPDRKTEVFRQKVCDAISGLSPDDLSILQNDRIGGFQFPRMPSVLFEYFPEWNRDYGPGESGMSHERIHETYASFYEHIVDNASDWEANQVAIASTMLARGGVGPCAFTIDRPSPRG